MHTKTTELVTLKIATGTSPALPGGPDVAVEWINSLEPRTRVEYGKALVDFARFVRIPQAMDLTADSTEKERAIVRSLAGELLCGMEPGQANGVVLGYRTSLKECCLSSATIRLRLAALRSIVKCAR